jgi:hypothetical protein
VLLRGHLGQSRGDVSGGREQRGVRPWAIDPSLAERLWTMGEAWTGVQVAAI